MEIYVKDGVIFKQINSIYVRIFKALFEAGDYIGKAMVITSVYDGQHRPDSLHYKHRAIDIRTVHLKPEERESLINFLRRQLGEDFDVIYEPKPPHIHIEYDPKIPK